MAVHVELLSQIRAVIQKAIYYERRLLVEIDGVRLHPSEIHVLLQVEAGRRTNATRMAERLGVTKGAISQTLARLEKKGLVTKRQNPRAKNELTLSFTARGRRAARRCRRIQDTVAGRFDAYLSSVGDDERRSIGRFLAEMSGILDEVR